jgi:hypothetical protein
VEPIAWVHKDCIEEYSSPPSDDVEEIAALGEMIDVDDDDPEYFVGLEREAVPRSRIRSAYCSV